jgi:hypothetical protein
MDPAKRLWGANVRPAMALGALAIVGVLGYGVATQSRGDDTRTVPVVSRMPGSSATLELSKGSATLEAHGLPQLPAGSVYQVWVQKASDAPEASSTLSPSAGGSATTALPGGVDGGDLVTVTREGGPGRPFPSVRLVCAAQIPR